jgi:NAD(P)-dependent dehydrogenase (short-subunit alcohol dehydrogenase family)
MNSPGLGFEGKTVIVTGASSGLGVQFAEALGAGGANLVLTARRGDRLDALAEKLGGGATVVVADISSEDARSELVGTAVERYGRIDGLVNNAGVAEVKTALKVSTEDFVRTLDVNLVAPFALARQVAAVMRGQDEGGSIVNIGSVSGIQPVSRQPMVSYVASKSGLIGMTRELASQWGRYGIRVNAVCPGVFPSEITGDEFASGPAADWIDTAVPLRRVGRPREVDPMLLLLLHPSSAYITGQVIAVDGGLSAAL